MAARAIARQILGTVIAVLSGWFAATLFLEVITLVQLLHQSPSIVPEALWVGPMVVSAAMAYLIIPVWLLLLIPLYVFVPTSSALWRPSICLACGVIAGVLIVGFWFRVITGVGGIPEAWPFYLIAAIVGGMTCFVGALTKSVFKPPI